MLQISFRCLGALLDSLLCNPKIFPQKDGTFLLFSSLHSSCTSLRCSQLQIPQLPIQIRQLQKSRLNKVSRNNNSQSTVGWVAIGFCISNLGCHKSECASHGSCEFCVQFRNPKVRQMQRFNFVHTSESDENIVRLRMWISAQRWMYIVTFISRYRIEFLCKYSSPDRICMAYFFKSGTEIQVGSFEYSVINCIIPDLINLPIFIFVSQIFSQSRIIKIHNQHHLVWRFPDKSNQLH